MDFDTVKDIYIGLAIGLAVTAILFVLALVFLPVPLDASGVWG